MITIAHRINTIKELASIPAKYGVEIDIRTYGNKLILNHEPQKDGDELEEYLKNYKHKFIIFNIKEAGIEEEVIRLAQKHNIMDYFLLDVEYPFIYKATRQMNFKKIAVRLSEAEPIEFALAHKGLVDWIWVDTNTKLPLNRGSYKKLKDAGFKICLVSPDRWGREKDIINYKKFLSDNKIIIDGVMCDKKFAEQWS